VIISEYLIIFRKSVEKFIFDQNLTRITATLHEAQCTCMFISLSVILRKRNISDQSCRENKNSHLYSVTFQENRDAFEIIWKKMW